MLKTGEIMETRQTQHPCGLRRLSVQTGIEKTF